MKIAKKILTIISVPLTILAIFVFAATVKFNRFYEVHICNQYSMLPTINLNLKLDGYVYLTGEGSENLSQPGDYLILDLRHKDFNRGDIITAEINHDGNIEGIVKRLVALPGDKLWIEHSTEVDEYLLYVNGEVLYKKPHKEFIGLDRQGQEIYLDCSGTYEDFLTYISNNSTTEKIGECEGKECIVLGEEEYFLLGDNWSGSYDCMDFGAIKTSQLKYKAVGTFDANSKTKWEMFKWACKLFFK